MFGSIPVAVALLCAQSVVALPTNLDITDILTKNANPLWKLQDDSIENGLFSLTQSQQNGLSALGSLDAPTFPKYISAGKSSSLPWTNKTAGLTNPYTSPPVTGVTRKYNFTIARGTLAPDGVEKEVMLINGQFPGPTIEANWGDTIEVTVFNNITDHPEGTSLHWHGLLQTSTNYEDGVPGITQCPIAPGQTHVYSFNADLYGSSWYHAHYSAQYTAGLYGAMVIHGPTDNAHYDIDLGPVLLADYYHGEYYDLVEDVMGTDPSKIAPYSDNNLINGKGIMNCSLLQDGKPCIWNAGLAKFQFTTGKTHRLRLINAGAEAVQKFTIDNHVMTVIATDFVPIVPYQTNIITLGVGQRADILVTANGNPTDIVWMRSTITSCSLTNQPDGLAMIYYPSADPNAKPTTQPQIDTSDPCANDDLATAVPYFNITPTAAPDLTIELDLNVTRNATGHFLWTVNNSTFRTDYNNPILSDAANNQSSTTFPDEWNVYNTGSAKSVRVVINNYSPVVHPMHIHGYNMYLLASGGTAPRSGTQASWDGSIVNPANPARRDTHLLEPNGFMVMQFDSVNPGVWPFHCHIAWHVSGGLYVNFMVQPELTGAMKVPKKMVDTCNSWDAWTGSNGFVDQIDSGL